VTVIFDTVVVIFGTLIVIFTYLFIGHFVAGQHDDARMCIAIALSAVRLGANVANHTEVLELSKHLSSNGKQVLSGARVRDRLTGIGARIFRHFLLPYFLRTTSEKNRSNFNCMTNCW